MMIHLRTIMTKLLKTYHPRVYHQSAPKTAEFPYIVFDFPNAFDNEHQEVFAFDVDVWDNKDDTTALELLSSTLWKELNYYRYIDENNQFSIYRDTRLPPLNDEDPSIKRRKLIFQLRYFDRRLFD